MNREIKLDEKQLTELSDVHQGVNNIKVRIADVTEQILQREVQRFALLKDLDQAREVYRGRVAKIATQLGVDVDVDQWGFQLEDGFIRVQPKQAEPAPAPEPTKLKAVE